MNIINVIDETVYGLITKFMSNGITNVMLFISHLGSAITLIVLAIAFILLMKDRINSKFITINLILVFFLNRILKWAIARPRPEVLKIIQETGYSFPSGHSMVSTGFYGFLIYLIYKNVKNKYLRYSLMSILFILIILIGISRVYLGVHYTSDVLGGFLISIAYLILYIRINESNLVTSN